MSEDKLAALQALIDRSVRTATPAVADSVAYPERQMTAAELVDFVRQARMIAMATVGPTGQPHIAPVHAELDGTTLRLVVYENTVRRQDIVKNPRVGFTTWKDGAVAILYGRAREVAGSLAEARPDILAKLKDTARVGTLAKLPDSVPLEGVALKTGTVRDAESNPRLGWIVAVDEDRVAVIEVVE